MLSRSGSPGLLESIGREGKTLVQEARCAFRLYSETRPSQFLIFRDIVCPIRPRFYVLMSIGQ